MNIPFLQDSTFTGLISTQNHKTSEEWAKAYSIVQSNSAVWDSAQARLWGTITGTLSNQTDLWVYLSADSDKQTLTYFPSSQEITISGGNKIVLNNVISKTQALAYSIAL